MEKVLKVFKVVFYALLFALAITFIVCLFYIPQETKDFVKGVMVFINQPLPIIGISILTLGFLIYKIIDITPIGRKGYNRIKEEIEKEKDKLIGYKEVVEDKLDKCKEKENETIALLNGFNDRVEELECYLTKVCETSPNAKINALGNEYAEKKVELKEEINQKYELGKNELAQTIETKRYDLESILKDLQELKEKVYGEETKDN